MSWPSTVEPSRNSTVVTLPSASLAVAVTVIVGFQAKTAPSAGEVMLTVGGVFAALTVIVDAALVVRGAEIVGRAGGERVGPGRHAAPGEAVRRGRVLAELRRAVEELDLRHRAVGVGRRRREIHRGGRREGRAVRRLRERDARRRVALDADHAGDGRHAVGVDDEEHVEARRRDVGVGRARWR